MNSFGNPVRDLVTAWWRHDRIRASPRDGRLWRLQPPCWIEVCGERVAVVGRTVGQTGRGAYIEYECESEAGRSRLRIESLSGGEVPRLTWHHGGRARAIDDEQVRPHP